MNVLTRRHPVPEVPAPEAAPGDATTIVQRFWDAVARRPAEVALRHHDGQGWRALTWAGYGTAVAELAAGLVALGLEPGDRAGILAGNQAAWHEADLAILSSGGISVPAYPTSASGQIAHVLRHAGVKVCFVGDRDQLAKVLLRRHRLPDLAHVVLLDALPDGLDDEEFLLHVDDLRALGRDRLAADPELVHRRSAEVDGSKVATIVYTSGTTGPPKGAVLTHANLEAAIAGITSVLPIGPEDRFLSFLPLSHIAERVVSHFGQIVSGGETWFARSLSTAAEDLRRCRPTIFFAVPRVWQKLQGAITSEIAEARAPERALAEQYLRWAESVTTAARTGGRAPLGARAGWRVLDRVVGATIRRQTGLDAARFLVSGAAPIDPDLLWWFRGLGMPIAEVYGQTEDCGPTSVNPPGAIRVGSVGLPLPGLAVRIADDHEILVRGPTVTPGYHLDPGATAALIDEDGWMHSGDLGRLDQDGYLYVTGRKKDLIITSSGKNIAPQEIEVQLERDPLIAEAIVVGDGRSYLTALLALDGAAVLQWGADRGKVTSFEVLLEDPDLRRALGEAVERANHGRAPIEQIKAWRLVPHELSISGGELTPTLKVRRDNVIAGCRALVDEMYA